MLVMPKLGVKNIIAGWPEEAKEIAEAVIKEYGEPNDANPAMLIWYYNGPWKRTIVYRDTMKHDFPMAHVNGLEQFINYEVPLEKYSAVAAFDGSVTLYRTRGEISACCHDEHSNFLALNLAHDIIQDKKTFDQARRCYAENVVRYYQHKPAPYMEKLQFTPRESTANRDKTVISQQELAKFEEE